MSADEPIASMSIAIQPGGPYLVRGGVPIRRTRDVESEHGEPLTSETTSRFPTDDVVALCRCGGSANKPFCDGTHGVVGFEGTETAATSTYDERAKTYATANLVMRDDRSICEHAGFCGNKLTNVWKMVRVADEDSIARSQLLAMIERCPSGALTYRMAQDRDDVEPELAQAIAVVDDGPLQLTGGLTVERADGQPFESRNRVTLCRCGLSSKKPLCDGTHRTSGFADRGA